MLAVQNNGRTNGRVTFRGAKEVREAVKKAKHPESYVDHGPVREIVAEGKNIIVYADLMKEGNVLIYDKNAGKYKRYTRSSIVEDILGVIKYSEEEAWERELATVCETKAKMNNLWRKAHRYRIENDPYLA